jgi:Protein of unknown function (DUF4240)
VRTIALLALGVAAAAIAYGLGSRRGEESRAVAPAAPVVARSEATAPAPRAAMDPVRFWGLVAGSRTAADNDTGRQSELLEERLRRLEPAQIADFERIRHRLDRRAYTWDLWGAAYVIEDGCSDDCFRDFRGYLISLGPRVYEAALRNPDSLASVVQDAETGDWENADDVAPDAYESVAGEDIPTGSSDLSGRPRGTPWDDDQVQQLTQRYPRLADRFR